MKYYKLLTPEGLSPFAARKHVIDYTKSTHPGGWVFPLKGACGIYILTKDQIELWYEDGLCVWEVKARGVGKNTHKCEATAIRLVKDVTFSLYGNAVKTKLKQHISFLKEGISNFENELQKLEEEQEDRLAALVILQERLEKME